MISSKVLAMLSEDLVSGWILHGDLELALGGILPNLTLQIFPMYNNVTI